MNISPVPIPALARSPKLTVLIPLKDNPQRLETLQNGNFPKNSWIQYWYLDGSESDANEKKLSPHLCENVRYIRYPHDSSVNHYLAKIADAATKVNTPYVMTADSGDLILPEGVASAICKLDSNTNISFSGGPILGSLFLFGRLTAPREMTDGGAQIMTNSWSIEQNLNLLKSTYSYTWYSIFRTRFFCKMWSWIAFRCFHYPVLEYAPTVYSIAKGLGAPTPQPHLLRIIHPPKLWTNLPRDFAVEEMNRGSYLQSFVETCDRDLNLPREDVYRALLSRFSEDSEQFRSNAQRVKPTVAFYSQHFPTLLASLVSPVFWARLALKA